MLGTGSRVGRKAKPELRKVTTSMRLDPAIRRGLVKLAERRGATISSIIETAISRELDRAGLYTPDEWREAS